jgi:O-acetyl-ADP-ribose deacetylase (regulator of RNase III)
MVKMQVNEVCKVLNRAVGREGNGYSLAKVNKVNKRVEIVLLDADYKTGAKSFTVEFNALWKIKAAQRKGLERKIFKASFPSPPEMTIDAFLAWLASAPVPKIPVPKIDNYCQNVMGLNTTHKISLGEANTIVYLAHGSVLDFTGNAIVNAANEGCLGGGGIDGEINRRGGRSVQLERLALPSTSFDIRCATGDAKITTAGELPCDSVIHAVGPRFYWKPPADDHTNELMLLDCAYKSAIQRAKENGLKSIGFCILSAGIFRGSCPLFTVIKKGVTAIIKYAQDSGIESVFFCAFTTDEQQALSQVASELANSPDESPAFTD